MKIPYPIIAIILLILTGCSTMAPEYKRPTPPIPDRWPQIEDTITSQYEREWQKFYKDTKLKTIVEIALENNRDLRAYASNAERMMAMYKVSRADLYPNINLLAGLNEQMLPAGVSQTKEAMDYRQYGINIGITSWEIDFFGRLRSLKDRMLEQYLASEEVKRGAKVSLIGEIASVYLTLAADKENLKLAKATLESQKETYDLIKKRYEVGLSSEMDLLQAQSRMDAIKTEVARYSRQIEMDINALNFLAGTTISPALLPNGMDDVVVPEEITPGIPGEVLLQRPDILQAEHQLKAANANIGYARAAFFPRISLTSTIGTISPDLENLFKAGSSTWTFVPQATLPIFTGGRNIANLKAAEAEREMYLNQYEKTIQAAFKEVSDILVQRTTLKEQIAAQESLVNASSKTLSLFEARYKKGLDGYLPLLDTQRTLFGAQQALINLRLASALNRILLYKALGGGG
ncbi:MAG: efflux transporter outer membrane subunit [Syntrophorhabdaceae bacterium]|nr:efflux transporter outer membrane subunit [Syntrophorhabdaceae bacterium]